MSHCCQVSFEMYRGIIFDGRHLNSRKLTHISHSHIPSDPNPDCIDVRCESQAVQDKFLFKITPDIGTQLHNA